ncbi:MAG: phage integrase SAM-like domain-containing protein [Ekhidna sp.]
MSTLNFFIEQHLNKTTYPIYIRYDHASKKVLFSTNFKASTDQINWLMDGARKKIKTSEPLNKRFIGHLRANKELISNYKEVQDLVFDARDLGDPSVHKVKELFKKSKDQVEVKTIIHGIDYIVSKIEGSGISERTLINYDKNLRKHIDGFNEYKSRDHQLNDLDKNFEYEYKKYLYNKDQPLSDGSVDNQIKYLKSLCRKLIDLGIPCNEQVQSFSRISLTYDMVFLTAVELKRLIDSRITSSDTLDRKKDAFVFQCLTGIRVSDLKKFNKDLVDDKYRLNTRSEKTGTLIKIPLVDKAIEIAEKYNYNIPVESEQKYNEAIHKFMKELGFDRKVESKNYRPLHEVCTSHTARKTFISYALNNLGLSVAEVSLISGTSQGTIQKHYAGANIEEIENKILQKSTRENQ